MMDYEDMGRSVGLDEATLARYVTFMRRWDDPCGIVEFLFCEDDWARDWAMRFKVGAETGDVLQEGINLQDVVARARKEPPGHE